MKDNNQLTDYLEEYLKMDTPQFAVMITGKWGCGKTYYIKERINTWNKAKVRSGESIIVLKPIYVSINGLNTISAIVRKIKTALNPILYSKGAKVAKQVILSTLRITTKANMDLDGDNEGEDFNSLVDAEGLLEIFKSDSASIKGNRVLIFDDVERCKIPLDELFGFVNGIVEHSNSKVVLVCDEDRLVEVAKREELNIEYKDFKEKLIGQTFALEVDFPTIAAAFIDAKKNNLLSDNKALIINLFISSGYQNLRLVRHCLIDIDRFFEQLPKAIEKNPSYKEFVSNVIAYLTISSLETRYGNSNIEQYQSFSMIDTDKKAARELESKYDLVLERHGMYNSAYTIPINNLVAFVNSGFLENPDYLVANCRMLQSRNMSNWEKLWRFEGLSNDEFASLLKQEKERFYNKQLEYVFEVAHLSGVLLSLEKKKLVKLSRKRVVSVAKSNVKSIYERFPEDWSRLMLNSQGYEFQEGNSVEMHEISKYVHELFQTKIGAKEKEYVAGVWNSIGTEITHQALYKLFDVSIPTKRCNYSYESIFTQVRPRVLVDMIVGLSNASKNEFSSFLVSRYYLKGALIEGTLTEEMKADKYPLTKISAMLKSRAKRLRLIDKEMTLKVADRIDEAVSKM